jgi:predicted PurR-regulated permease PerM
MSESRRQPDVAASAPGTRSLLATGLSLIAICVILFLIWKTATGLLLIFAGVLFAALLDALTRMLGTILPIGRGWRSAIVIVLFVGLCGLGLLWGIQKLPEQSRLLFAVMEAQLDVVQQHLLTYGIDLLGPEGGQNFAQWLFSDQSRLFSHAQILLGGASSVLTGALIVLFLGIFFALDPAIYRESLVILVSPLYRGRVCAVLDEMGRVLRLWFVGQLIRVVLMTLCVWTVLYLLDFPSPFLLGLQAGLSNFIPYFGPIIAAVPIGLVAMPYGSSTLIWALVIYTVIQSLEGYLIGPLIQRQAIAIPPAWTLVALVLLGAIFGVLGIALAMPLVAVFRIAIVRLYVEGFLAAPHVAR